VAEVGSEHCDSDGHDTDLENADDPKGQNTDQIEVLKGNKWNYKFVQTGFMTFQIFPTKVFWRIKGKVVYYPGSSKFFLMLALQSWMGPAFKHMVEISLNLFPIITTVGILYYVNIFSAFHSHFIFQT